MINALMSHEHCRAPHPFSHTLFAIFSMFRRRKQGDGQKKASIVSFETRRWLLQYHSNPEYSINAFEPPESRSFDLGHKDLWLTYKASKPGVVEGSTSDNYPPSSQPLSNSPRPSPSSIFHISAPSIAVSRLSSSPQSTPNC